MEKCDKHEHSLQISQTEQLSEIELERICNIFRILGEQSRMKIVLALTGGELCVYHILEAVGGTQSGVSHQLRILKDNRIVKSRRDGQNILYSITDEHILKIVAMGKAHLSCEGV